MDKEKFWKDIWDEKRRKEMDKIDTNDPIIITGYNIGFAKKECGIINFEERWDLIRKKFNILDSDSILEIGCAAGCLATYAHDKYVGIDLSKYMVEQFNKLNKNKMAFFNSDTTNIFFPDNSFDYVISDSVFHYFKDTKYAVKVLGEMKRISKNCVVILNLRYDTAPQREEHLKYVKSFFIDNSMEIFHFKEEEEYFYNCYYNKNGKC